MVPVIPPATLSAPAAAERRRSIRQFRDEKVSSEVLDQLLSLAGRAPSAFNLQPWRLVVVQDAALRERLCEAALGQPQVKSASVVLALYTDMVDTMSRLDEVLPAGLEGVERESRANRIRGSFDGQDAAALEEWGARQGNIYLGYLLLLAESLGLGTSPMLGFVPEQVRALLEIPGHAPVVALVALGWPGQDGVRSERHAPGAIARFR